MNQTSPDPVHKLFKDILLDRPPSTLPLAEAPEIVPTPIPISDDDPLAQIMDAAAREAREQDGRQS